MNIFGWFLIECLLVLAVAIAWVDLIFKPKPKSKYDSEKDKSEL